MPLPNSHSPVIVGEHYDLAETLALKQSSDHNGGLLGKPDYQSALLSMSSVEGKSAIDELNPSKSPFPAFLQSNYNPTQSSSSSVTGLASQRNSIEQDSIPFDADSESPYENGASEQQQAHETTGRDLPEITSLEPRKGPSGCHLTIYIRSTTDLLSEPEPLVSLSFGTKQIYVKVIRLETTGSSFEYGIIANAPSFSETGSADVNVELKLHIQEPTGQGAGSISIGSFEYTGGQQYASDASAKKRKLSEESEHTANGRASYPYANTLGSTSSPDMHAIDLNTVNRRFTPYGRAQHQQRYRDPYSLSPSVPSQGLIRSMSSSATAWNPNYSGYASRSPGYPGETQTVSLTTSEDTPMLVRTTALGQNGSPGGNAPGPSGFNPYAYPQKAVLKIHGDLNKMTENWTPDEWAAKRRLVQFTRSQAKSTINATFAPVAPEDRPPNSICISCIWWEERQECFATSVDTISLLESLVAMRFTVEEKNRIRRNLEGFHPETVSKGKTDSEEFFKLIMQFPNPKPRNIEKDVKIFSWKILGHALKKIISKYSASYASTSGVIGTPRTSPSFYDSPGYSRSVPDNSAQVYTPTMRAATMSPHGMPAHLDTPLSASLPSIGGSEYSLSTVGSPYTDNGGYFPSHMYNHHRTSSATEYDAPRPFKRARASTTNALSYTSHDAASLLSDMSMTRSMSDHGSNHRLPSLTEGYSQPSPSLSHHQMRSTYDFGGYLDTQHEGVTSG